VGFLGHQQSQFSPCPTVIGDSQGQLHPEALCNLLQAAPNCRALNLFGRPGSQQGHAKFSAGDLFFQGLDIGTHAK